ncbi:LamG domain-containing protein [Flavobacteriales bacterium]|nr:LamG domain-containing protein [Flavobacteriales bacterium]
MNKIHVQNGQSLFDIALQEFGDIAGVFELLTKNNIAWDADFEDELLIDGVVLNKDLVNYYLGKSLKINSGWALPWTNNKAVELDGVTDYLISEELTDDVKIDQDSNFTIGMWIKPQWPNTSSNVYRSLFAISNDIGGDANATAISVYYREGVNRLIVDLRSNVGGAVYNQREYQLFANNSITGLGTLLSDRWHVGGLGNSNSDGYVFLTVIYEGTSSGDKIRLYWNAQELAEHVYNSSGILNINKSGQRLVVGSNAQSGNYSACRIGEIDIWNKALTQSEINTNYNSGVPVAATTEGLVENYLFEIDTNSEFNKNNLTNNGAEIVDI